MSTLLSSRCYGNRQSLAARQRERLAMCFESYEEAKRRCETSQKAENEKRSPIGNFENMQWDKQALLEEVNSYADGTVNNWSALARQYQVKNKNGEVAKNGGQIVKEYLKSQGVDVTKFKKRGLQEDEGSHIRKKKKRSAGGEITVPCPVTNENLKKKLNQKILSGEYNVGELIVPRQVGLAQLCHIITRHIY